MKKNLSSNVSRFCHCYGCGVCAIACPKKIIDLELNKDGFYSPVIHEPDECINCGICLDICAFNHDELAAPPNLSQTKGYGCWSKDSTIRQQCTTGGMGYEIVRNSLEKGYKACVVKYNISEERAEHYIVYNESELKAARGSKYIPSFTQSGFELIGRNEQSIVVGLPCQIDSFRRYIRRFKIEDKFQLVDLLCHGTPSLLLWQRYVREIKKLTGPMEDVKFRSKVYGWHKSSCVEIKGKLKDIIHPDRESLFYGLFFTDSCFNKCCHGRCKYKLLASSADIRIGDFWGEKYAQNEKGVNALIAFTPTGRQIVDELKEKCVFEASSLEEAMDKQMSHNAPLTPFRGFLMWGFRNNVSLKLLYTVVRYGNLAMRPNYVVRQIISKIKH